MKIYTRAGDRGETGLFDGTRVSKADARVDAYGEVDELNAALGLARALGVDVEVADEVEHIQRDLHAVGALLADPQKQIAPRVSKATIDEARISELEALIDRFDEELPPLRRFILSGGCPLWCRPARGANDLQARRTPHRRAGRVGRGPRGGHIHQSPL